MSRSPRCLFAAFTNLAILAPIAWTTGTARAEIPVPNYNETALNGVFPAGGQRGTSVVVQFFGETTDRKKGALIGLRGARDVLVEGPPGITVRDVENINDHRVRATFDIAADAAPGRRMVRVKCDRIGLTNACYFTVGTLPECRESGDNNAPAEAQAVQLPVVVNGNIGVPLDVDCFRFTAQAGQKLVLAVASYDLDVRSRANDARGFADFNLELLDSEGRVVADADDTIGLDPLLHTTIPADGMYVARLSLAGFKGFPESSYRLTLGEVAYPTAIFPAGGRRGTPVEVEFRGPNVPPGTRAIVQIPLDDDYSLQHRALAGDLTGTHDVVFHPGDLPEAIEQEPNADRTCATPVAVPSIVNGEFAVTDDEDWYRLELGAGQKIALEIVAQRYLRAPVDTVVEVYDATGKRLAENDDSSHNEVEQIHDYNSFDSSLEFAAKKAGVYFVRVRDQAQAGDGRSVYRMKFSEPKADFALHQWPDAVPVWGPGTTAAFVVTVDRSAQLAATDVEVQVEGLPPGWVGSTSVAPAKAKHQRVFLTITAPVDAQVGDMTEFRVVGRARIGEQVIERHALPLTVYYPNDRAISRLSRRSRVVVAAPQGPWLGAEILQATCPVGGQVEIPVRLFGGSGEKSVELAVNRSTSGFRCADAPKKISLQDGVARLPVRFEKAEPGVYGVAISLPWRGDIRQGMPGPCTPIVLVHVVARDAIPLTGKPENTTPTATAP